MARGRPWVAVVGPGEATAAEAALAERAGAEVGRRGGVLVCGGLGGAMAAACRGARREGALTVGLLPGLDREGANPDVDVALPTGLGEGRNVLLVRAADALVAVGGGWGTLSEIALAMRARKPVAGVDTWEPLRGGAPAPGIARCETPEEAVVAVLRDLAARG